jgi:outer membrane biosynthesis protein TonB
VKASPPDEPDPEPEPDPDPEPDPEPEPEPEPDPEPEPEPEPDPEPDPEPEPEPNPDPEPDPEDEAFEIRVMVSGAGVALVPVVALDAAGVSCTGPALSEAGASTVTVMGGTTVPAVSGAAAEAG